MCGTAMPQVNSDANTPPGAAGLVHLLADDHRVGAVAAATADRFGQAGAEQPGLAGLAVQLARQLAAALPLVDVGQHFAFGERAHRLSEFFALGGVPDVHDKNSSGMSMCRLRSHSPSPLACGSNRAWYATPCPRMPSMTKLTARRLGSRWRVTRRSAVSGSNSRSFVDGQRVRQPPPLLVGAHPHPDVGVAALVAAARAGDRSRAAPARVSPNGSGSGSANGGDGSQSRVCGGRRRCRCGCRRRAPRRAAPRSAST